MTKSGMQGRWTLHLHPGGVECKTRAMILFAADNHYGARPGAVLNEALQSRFPMHFAEDDWSALADPALMRECRLLILNLISGTGTAPVPGEAVERQVRAYLERGAPLLLLHGASAAFWQWDWWRPLVGFRWVRPSDPDGFAPSTHPRYPCCVTIAKNRHPLCRKLQPMELPDDEVYIGLEQTCPAITLMETTLPEGTFPQCYICETPWGGTLAGFLPGHTPEVTRHPGVVENVSVLIRHLLRQA